MPVPQALVADRRYSRSSSSSVFVKEIQLAPQGNLGTILKVGCKKDFIDFELADSSLYAWMGALWSKKSYNRPWSKGWDGAYFVEVVLQLALVEGLRFVGGVSWARQSSTWISSMSFRPFFPVWLD